MKKFLVFLFSIVVVVCLSLTTYYFVRNNEIITIKTKEIYCNAGDTIPLKSLGISIEKANISKKTKFNYNAGGEDVTKFIKYESASSSFVVSQENAGEVTLVISTTNKKYPDFTINVHIGNGSAENPYYIFNETELERIGSVYRLDKHYKLMKDISLTSNFTSIGYNDITSTWDGFNGTFNGQGHSIKGLNLTDVEAENIGLFSSLNSGSKVSNLTIENANISGSYKNVGVLAGVMNGDVEKVVVLNSNLTNNSSDSRIGAIAGTVAGNIKMSYANNVSINTNGTDETPLTNVKIGGFVGILQEGIIQACYANNVEITTTKTSALTGGFVGDFIIGTETGSIQQSYANTTSNDDDFAAFIAEILPNNNFTASSANMLRHLIGNFAVVSGTSDSNAIQDNQLVSYFDNTYFVNHVSSNRSVFFDKDAALYLIRGFATSGEVISTNEFIYYAVDVNTITNWDTTYVWNTAYNSLPTLRMGNIYPSSPSSEYLTRNLEQIDLGSNATFVDVFSSDVANESIKLSANVDLTSGWKPVAISNCTIDGAGYTITLTLDQTSNGSMGLFSSVNNSTIKNLNIVIKDVKINATNVGAVAGTISSNDGLTYSLIENVSISFENISTVIMGNFGGVAGTLENTMVKNVEIKALPIATSASISNAGAIAGKATSNVKISDSQVNASISALFNGGGVVGENAGAITNVTGSVTINGNSNQIEVNFGGVAGINNGTIQDVDLTVNANLANAGLCTYIGGIVGDNTGSVKDVTINGDSIAISTDSEGVIYLGGIVGVNSGNIQNVVNNIASVGTYKADKKHYVGGVVAINNGIISKVVTQSNLNGNYVSGVVAKMNNLSASIDQVVVGKYDAKARTLSQNEIKADKYIAGVSVDFQAGTITNIQASSKLIGASNSTRSSLVTLIFAYGANLKNATIDSAFSGYGERYRESWTDFASYTNKAEFSLTNGETGDERFNVYKYDSYHGSMQSVVINGEGAGVSGAKAAMGSAFAWTKDYQDTEESSFIKVVNGFKDANQFQGKFTFVCSISTLGIKHEATKELTFSIGNIWESNNGISLMFLDEIFA